MADSAANTRQLSRKDSRKIARDVARAAFRGGEYRLALAILLWPAGWSHTKLEANRAAK